MRLLFSMVPLLLVAACGGKSAARQDASVADCGGEAGSTVALAHDDAGTGREVGEEPSPEEQVA